MTLFFNRIKCLLLLLVVGLSSYAQRYEYKGAALATDLRAAASKFSPVVVLPPSTIFKECAYNMDNQMYVLDEDNACIYVLSEIGQLLGVIKSVETTTGKVDLKSPRHLCVDRFNNLFVYDSKLGHILKIPPRGDALEIGVAGWGAGQLGDVTDLSTDSKGNCYTLNRSRNVVDVYSADGKYLTWITGATPFRYPIAIGHNDADELYVLEGDGPTVVVFNDEGNVVNTNRNLGTRKNVLLKSAQSMAVMSNGDFFILDEKSYVVYHFNRVGDVLGSLGSKGAPREGVFEEAVHIACMSGIQPRLGVVDEEAGSLQTFLLDHLKLQQRPTTRRIKMVDASTLRSPVLDLAVSPNGLRFTIPANNRSKVIAYKDTSQVDAFTISGVIEEAVALACDSIGNLYVADAGTDEVLMFDSGGKLLRRMGKEIEDELKNPTGIAIQSNGNIVVADEGHGSLMLWNSKGQFVKEITSEANSVIRSPIRIDRDSKDQIYVWDDNLNAILRVGSGGWPTAEKQLKVRSEKPGGSPGEIGDFYVDPLDQIHVYNKSNHQIEVYSWEFEPVLIYSIGHPGKDAGAIGDVTEMMIDTRTLNIYLTQEDGKSQKVFHYLIPPPMPEGAMVFDVVDGKLTANFSKLKSKAVVAYGLTRPTASGDSVAYRTEGSSFTITQSPLDHTLYHYDFVALSWSDYSAPAMGFEDYFNYAEAMVDARKYQEALGSWTLAMETMGKQAGLVEYIARRLAEVSTLLIQQQNIDLAIEYVKQAFRLSPKSELVKSKYRDAVMAQYSHLVNQREINAVISDMQLNINNVTLRGIYLETADTLARVLSLQDNLNSINDAIKVQKKMLEWDNNPKYKEALGFSYFELYKFKSIRETSSLELRSILEESLANSRDANNLLKASGQRYFAAHLTQIAAMNELGKYQEVQAQASAELGASASMMSKEVLVSYRKELARAFAAQGNHSGAEAEYNTIVGIDPTDRSAQEMLVEELIVSAKYDAASDVLHQLMLGKEENPAYTMLLGRIALLKVNYAEAIFQLEKALSKDPSMQQVYAYLADAYSLAGNNTQAIKYYNLAIQYADEQIAKTGQGNRVKQQNEELPKERLRFLNASVRINLELQDYTSALSAAQRLVKLDESVAASHYSAGTASLRLGRFYKAIEYFKRAIGLNPDQAEYTSAMTATQKLLDQQMSNSTPLVIGDVLVNEIYPSFYKNYSNVHQLPAGEFIVTNNTDEIITPLSITVYCPDVMSSPTQVNAVPVSARSNWVIRFPALFTDAILENTEARNLQLEVTLTYSYQGVEQSVRKSGSFVLNSRNAILWSDKRRMASFIAPGSEMLVDYNKRAEQVFKGMPKFGINRSVLKAGQLYTLLNRSELTYSSDPNQGYASLSYRTEVKDFLQFPLETMMRKGGDCDDLVALYAALLESGGVSAAYIDVPGHVMAAFDCGIKPTEMAANGLLPTDVIVMNDRVWIPIEATKIGTAGFFQAWKAAAERYYRELEAGHFPEIIPFADAWNIYTPSNYQPKGYSAEVPSGERVKEEYRQFVVQFVSKSKQNALDELSARYVAEPENVFVRNAYGTLLTQTGQYEKARKVFLETAEMMPENAIIINNLGNIDFLQGKYADAIRQYEMAAQIDDEDAQIYVNLCKARWQLGDKQKAREDFEKAVSLDASVSDIYQELKKQIE